MENLKTHRLKIFCFLFFILFISTFFKIISTKIIYNEIDDNISLNQLLIYEKLNIYDIANNKNSKKYNTSIRTLIRDIQKKQNKYFDSIVNIASNQLKKISPSFTSTYAPLQYWLFSGLINSKNNYKKNKLYSAFPSIFFSILAVLITFTFSLQIFFNNKNKYIFSALAASLMSFSYPNLYLSSKSYTYAAGIFTTILLFNYIYLNIIKLLNLENSFLCIKHDKINFLHNFYISIFLSLLLYLNYSILFLAPLFFLILFLTSFKVFKLNKKKIYNTNLFIIGVLFIILSTPIIFHLIDFDLINRGTMGGPGLNNEYLLDKKSNSLEFFKIFMFYLKNLYLIITKNLSFFLDIFLLSEFIQFIIFIFFLSSFIYIFRKSNFRKFLYIIIIFFIYYFFLVYFQKLTMGPTRHLNIYNGIFSLLITIGISNIFEFYNLSIKTQKKILYFFIGSIVIIFLFNFKNYYYFYSNPINEKYIFKISQKYNAAYLHINQGVFHICFFNLLKNIKINLCPVLNESGTIENLNVKLLKKIKEYQKSVIFIQKDKNEEIPKNILDALNQIKFKRVDLIQIEKFYYNNSPLFISKMNPNNYLLSIYK